MAVAMTSLAQSLMFTGQLEQAAATIDGALSIMEACGQTKSNYFAVALRRRGSILEAQGRAELALE